MVSKVAKQVENEQLLKTNWQRKTYPLKLNLNDIQKARIDYLISEYKKATNKIIDIVLNDFFKNYLVRVADEDIKKGLCPLCQKEKKLTFELLDFEFIEYAEGKKGKNYKPIFRKGKKTLICESCHCSHYSLRKFLLPSSRRELPIPQWDFTKKVDLGDSTSIYDSCLQKAVETIKSQVEIKKKIDYKIKFYNKRIENNQIILNEKGKDFEKFKNKYKKEEKEAEKLLNKFIVRDKKVIEKEQKKKASKIEYKANSIRLYENSYQLIQDKDDFFIKLKNYSKGEWITIMFYGEDYQKKKAQRFINSKNAETELLKKGNDYFLQYIYRKEVDVPIPDETFTAVGIDVNIINLACHTCMKKDLIPFNIRFFSGRRLRRKRRQFSKIRRIWNSKTKYKEHGGKGRSKKWFNDKCKIQGERDYIKYKIHNLTTFIVQEIKDKIDKPVIVLENLKDIRDKTEREIKIAKTTLEKFKNNQKRYVREYRKLTLELNTWNFDDFQKFIEYKANWLGIPVIYVNAKDTSIECKKCGNIDEKNYSDLHELKFVCSKCGYKSNIDFNASYNIGKRFFQEIKSKLCATPN